MDFSLNGRYEKIITGEMQHTFNFLGMSLLFTRLIGRYKSNPTSDTLKACMEEVNAFVAKYERVLGKELESLSKVQ